MVQAWIGGEPGCLHPYLLEARYSICRRGGWMLSVIPREANALAEGLAGSLSHQKSKYDKNYAKPKYRYIRLTTADTVEPTGRRCYCFSYHYYCSAIASRRH